VTDREIRWKVLGVPTRSTGEAPVTEPQSTLTEAHGSDIDVPLISEDEEFEPLSLVYEDDDIGRNGEPVSGQLEPDDPDDRASREGPFVRPGEGEL
jgi:hypothetical protein